MLGGLALDNDPDPLLRAVAGVSGHKCVLAKPVITLTTSAVVAWDANILCRLVHCQGVNPNSGLERTGQRLDTAKPLGTGLGHGYSR